MGEIIAISTSSKKGVRKDNIEEGFLSKGKGLDGDAHAGFGHRQLSLLARESIDQMIAKGLSVGPGDFAENLTTSNINLVDLPVGTRLKAGSEAVLRVTQIGKECHNRCAIYYQAGDCVMPREGIFTEVLQSGLIRIGDSINVLQPYKFGIITASDKGSKGEREDLSGPAIEDLIMPFGDVADRVIVPDDRSTLAEMMRKMCSQNIDAIFTTGGTGLGPRDITPEATRDVIDREVFGIPEAVRRETYKVTLKAMLSRGISGIRGKTLIINLPGSPKAVKECLTVILPVLEHALETVTGRGGECART